jgi:hypothetical protein
MGGAVPSRIHQRNTLEPDQTATIDHIVPKLLRGYNHTNNIVVACWRCNNLRGHLSYRVFKRFADLILVPNPYLTLFDLRAILARFVDRVMEAVLDEAPERFVQELSLALTRAGHDVEERERIEELPHAHERGVLQEVLDDDRDREAGLT